MASEGDTNRASCCCAAALFVAAFGLDLLTTSGGGGGGGEKKIHFPPEMNVSEFASEGLHNRCDYPAVWRN